MALRHLGREPHPLNPEEARTFLRIHAERESARHLADAPSVEDLAETLDLSPEEAWAILREVRTRPVAVPSYAWLTRTGLAALVLLPLVMLALLATMRSAEAGASVPTPPAPVWAPPVPVAPPAPSFGVPAGFQVEVRAATFDAVSVGPADGLAPDPRDLSHVEGAGLRERLVTAIVGMVDAAPKGGGTGFESRLTVRVGRTGTRPTSLEIPMEPYGFEPARDFRVREGLRAALSPLLAAAWPEIVGPER